MQLEIKKAERRQKKAKLIISGTAKSGKTLSALRIARGIVGQKQRFLVLDSERSSATLYAGDPEFSCDFDHADLPNSDPETYIAALYQAAKAGYPLVIIDSLSHSWEATLENHTKITTRMKTPNSFTAWAEASPPYAKLMNAIISYPGHTIVTARAKSAYVLEDDGKGKQRPRKVGLASILRPGSDFEFDLIGRMDVDHNLIVEGTRYRFLDGEVINKPGEEFGQEIAAWLGSGKEPEPKKAPSKTAASEYDITRETHPYAYSYDETELSLATPEEQQILWKTLQEKFHAMRIGRVIRTSEPVPGWEDAACKITED